MILARLLSSVSWCCPPRRSTVACGVEMTVAARGLLLVALPSDDDSLLRDKAAQLCAPTEPISAMVVFGGLAAAIAMIRDSRGID